MSMLTDLQQSTISTQTGKLQPTGTADLSQAFIYTSSTSSILLTLNTLASQYETVRAAGNIGQAAFTNFLNGVFGLHLTFADYYQVFYTEYNAVHNGTNLTALGADPNYQSILTAAANFNVAYYTQEAAQKSTANISNPTTESDVEVSIAVAISNVIDNYITQLEDYMGTPSDDTALGKLMTPPQYYKEAVQLITAKLSQPNIANAWIVALISGLDPVTAQDKIALDSQIVTLAMYYLMFGITNLSSTMQNILDTAANKENGQVNKIFGSLPYAMSEIYATVSSYGTELQGIYNDMSYTLKRDSGPSGVLTTLNLTIPEARLLDQFAENDPSFGAIGQTITSATTNPGSLSQNLKDQGKNAQTSKGATFDIAAADAYNVLVSQSVSDPLTRSYMYSYINDKSIALSKMQYALQLAQNTRITPDSLTPYVSVAFYQNNNWFITKIPTVFMYGAVTSVDISKSRDNPSDTAVVVLSNKTGVLTDFYNNQYTTQYKGAGTQANMPGIFVEPGMNIQIRMGYTPIFENMDVTFNGIVQQVQAGDDLIIQAVSFGSELLKTAYVGNENLGVLLYANPRDMIVNALSKIAAYDLGAPSFFDWLTYTQEQQQTMVKTWVDYVPFFLPFQNMFSQAPQYFQNIYAPDRYWPSGSLSNKANYINGAFLDNFSMLLSRYSTQPGDSAWKVMQDAANRMPSYVLAVRNADERQTVFFGHPEYPYRFTFHPEFFAANQAANQTATTYTNILNATISTSNFKQIGKDFDTWLTSQTDAYSSQFSQYWSAHSSPSSSATTDKATAANNFATMILGSRSFVGILSGFELFVPQVNLNVQAAGKTNAQWYNETLQSINTELTNKMNEGISKVQAFQSSSNNSQTAQALTDAISTITDMYNSVYGLYNKQLQPAVKIFSDDFNNSYGQRPLVASYVATMLMAFSGDAIDQYENAVDQMEQAVYSAFTGADFSVKMAVSTELTNQAVNSVKPSAGIPQQLIPQTGKIPATLEGETMFRRYWVADSQANIVENIITTDPAAIATSITCFGKSVYSGWDWASLLVWRLVKFIMSGQNTVPETTQQINGIKMYGFKVSASEYIIPTDRSDQIYVDENANMPQIRALVASSVLADKLMRGYNGSITLLGNHLIEPYDSIAIRDDTTQMTGLVDVREVMHHMSAQTGFITRVIPDMRVGIRDLTIEPLTTAVNLLINVAEFALVTAGVAAITVATGGVAPIIAVAAGTLTTFSMYGMIRQWTQLAFPPLTMATRNSFVRDTSLDAGNGISQEDLNGIGPNSVIEWKFNNAMMIYPLFIADSYYMPRLRGYNWRDNTYFGDIEKNWNLYWDEVSKGMGLTAQVLGLDTGTVYGMGAQSAKAIQAQTTLSNSTVTAMQLSGKTLH